MKQKIYLAGPDVFLPNAIEVGKIKKDICDKYGFTGCFPFDNEIKTQNKNVSEIAFLISKANETLIRSCDIIVANLTPFRSPSADVGTIYEIGFGKALGKKCYGYSNTNILFNQRVKSYLNITKNTDTNGMAIENFELIDNLMIDGGIKDSGGFIVYENVESDFNDFYIFEKCISLINIK